MASKYGGYMGRILHINLTTKEITDYPFLLESTLQSFGVSDSPRLVLKLPTIPISLLIFKPRSAAA